MQENEILNNVGKTLTEDPIEITVDIYSDHWLKSRLQKWFPKLVPKQRKFLIRPITLGNLARISRLLLSIPKEMMDEKRLLESNYMIADQHAGTLAMIIAIAIHNRKSEPPYSLVNVITEQFTAKETFKVLMIVLKQMDVSSFMSSIISIRGLNVLETKDVSVEGADENEVSPMSQGV